MLTDRNWNSNSLGHAVRERSVRLILFQASAFALFMVMSQAWTDFFESIVYALMPQSEDLWLALVRALASTGFCVLLLGFMMCVLNAPVDYDGQRHILRVGNKKFRTHERSITRQLRPSRVVERLRRSEPGAIKPARRGGLARDSHGATARA